MSASMLSTITAVPAVATVAAAASMPASINVIDPMNRSGKICVPMHLVDNTRGLADHFLQQQGYQTAGPRDLSLCLLFQNGRCHAGDRCNQIHAAPTFVQELRSRITNNCCAAHGDSQSTSYTHDAAATVTVFDAQGNEETLPLSSFARTSALDAALMKAKQFGTRPRINRSRTCRLHQSRRCKFGQDCKNVHICNGAGNDAPRPAPMATFSAPMAASQRRMPVFEPRKTASCNSSASSAFGIDALMSQASSVDREDHGELSMRSGVFAPPMMCPDVLESSSSRKTLALTDLWSNEFSKLEVSERVDISVFANAFAGFEQSPLMSNKC